MAPVELEATLNRASEPCLGCGFPSPLICFTKTLLKAPFHCWLECKLVQPLWGTVWRFLKKLEIELSYDPAIPLGIHTEETRSERDTCTPVFTAAQFVIAGHGRHTSADERIRKYGTCTQWNITQPLKIIHLNQF